MTGEEKPAVVEWGSDRPGRLAALAGGGGGGRSWPAALPWAPAGLGGLALFGSLVEEWQVILAAELAEPGEAARELGLGQLLTWGAAWSVGGVLLVACVGLTLRGAPVVAGQARILGLSLAAGLGIYLAALSLRLREESLYGGLDFQMQLGRGVYLAFLTVVCLAAAMWLARPGAARALAAYPPSVADSRPATGSPPPPADPPRQRQEGPQLTVGPAEPFTHLPHRDEWR